MDLGEIVMASLIAGMEPEHRRKIVCTMVAAEICTVLWPKCEDDKAAEEHMGTVIPAVEEWIEQYISVAQFVGTS